MHPTLGLRDIRLAKAWTQQELAERSGVSSRTLICLEHGQRLARPSTLRRLAKALGVSTKRLMQEPRP